VPITSLFLTKPLFISAFGSSPKAEIGQFFSQMGGIMSQNLSESVLHRYEKHRISDL
jgi:hypothetical protein